MYNISLKEVGHVLLLLFVGYEKISLKTFFGSVKPSLTQTR